MRPGVFGSWLEVVGVVMYAAAVIMFALAAAWAVTWLWLALGLP